MKHILALLLACMTLPLMSQTNYALKPVNNGEYVYVASTLDAYNPLASNNKDRVLRDIALPKGTVGYTVRVVVSESGTKPPTSLLSALGKMGPMAALGAEAAQLAFRGDGNRVDVFIFDDMANAAKFANKQEGWWACDASHQAISMCKPLTTCLDAVKIGFRNNNGATGLNLYLEVVAIVDPARENFTPEVRETVFDNCMKEERIDAVGQRKGEFCACLADKLANDPKLLSSSEEVAEALAIEYGKTCMVDLKLVSGKAMGQEMFYQDVKNIESTSGKTGVISYCEEKISEGSCENYIYNCVGWNCLITKQFTKAEHYLNVAKDKYPLDLYIQGNYANALLLTGRHEEAMQIYRRYLNENISEDRSWKDAVASDIRKFKELGVVNEHFDEILLIVK